MEFSILSTDILFALFILAIVAGFIDTLVGGGGLLVLPALMLSGVPPLSALATNKLQGTMGTATSTYVMFKKGKLLWPEIKPLMISAFIGSACGTVVVQLINTQALSVMIPVVLVLITVYFIIQPYLNTQAIADRVSKRQYQNGVIPVVGFYDGMFGPGTGSFFSLAGVAGKGYDLIRATSQAKPLNFSTNIAALMVFCIAGQVAWVVGCVMVCGQALGAWLGAHCLFTMNPRYLRWAIVVMCIGMLYRYCVLL